MIDRKLTILILATVAVLAEAPLAQQTAATSSCMVEYENHNQIDYGPLIVRQVKGRITEQQQTAVPNVCVGIFAEQQHKLIATTESDSDGNFSIQRVPPGRYRLIVKADPLCAANVPLKVVNHQRRKRILQIHMKPRGLDSCSYGETVEEREPTKKANMAKRKPIRDVSVDSEGNLTKNTGFLRAERNLLENHGWRFDLSTSTCKPPG